MYLCQATLCKVIFSNFTDRKRVFLLPSFGQSPPLLVACPVAVCVATQDSLAVFDMLISLARKFQIRFGSRLLVSHSAVLAGLISLRRRVTCDLCQRQHCTWTYRAARFALLAHLRKCCSFFSLVRHCCRRFLFMNGYSECTVVGGIEWQRRQPFAETGCCLSARIACFARLYDRLISLQSAILHKLSFRSVIGEFNNSAKHGLTVAARNAVNDVLNDELRSTSIRFYRFTSRYWTLLSANQR